MEVGNLEIKSYPKSKNFRVVDTIGVPHPYCITPKHLSSDRMYLDGEAIREAEEKKGAVCDICRKLRNDGKQDKVLSYDEHEQALLVECDVDFKGKDGKANPELQKYLLKIKARAEKDKIAGFAFKKNF